VDGTVLRLCRARVGDGRSRLATVSAESVDVVIGDAFDGPLPPRHLASIEFTERVRQVLDPDGLYLINVIDGPPFLLTRIAARTVSAAFPHVVVSAPAGVLDRVSAGNVIVLASRAPIAVEPLLPSDPESAVFNRIVTGRELAALVAGAPVLNDRDESWLAVFRRVAVGRSSG
jgi:spermidine synthase